MRTRSWIAAGWFVLLAASYVVRHRQAPAALDGPGTREVSVSEVKQGRATARTVRLAFQDEGPTVPPTAGAAPTVVLLHGSPGGKRDMAGLARALADRRRVLTPDLPGFGASTRDLADYSMAAHARYVLQLLDALGVQRVHLVGFSMGGGVALELAHLAPARVASLTMLSSIGVQEHELLGSYELNHALHAAKLGALWLATHLLPHFGALDRWALDLPYARNFYDSDQRPLRDYLRGFAAPALIVHGEQDPLVSAAAAREHHRLLPQSQLVMLPGSHFYVFTQPDVLARSIGPFVDRAERGEEPTRATADPGRLVAATADLDHARAIPVHGLARIILVALLVLGTLLSEDLACVAAGMLVVHGRLEFAAAVAACYAGILGGDLALYALGRLWGRRLVARAPWRWLLRPHDLDDARRWYAARGTLAVFLSRFLPGARTATYFVAGLVRASFSQFAGALAVAAAVWVPLLVGFATLTGDRAAALFRALSLHWLAAAALALLSMVALLRGVIPLSNWRGRRLLIGGLCRRLKWEFWPLPLFYVPVAAHIGRLALRHRSLSLVTAVNPAMPAGGLVGESKDAILTALAAAAPGRVAPHVLLPASARADRRVRLAEDFRSGRALTLPLVLKPDVGQRGEGVAVVRDEAELRARVAGARRDLLLQQYVPGMEFGVFYARRPTEAHGRIFSITEKRMPVLVGDGRRDLETLILTDERAVCMARTYMQRHAAVLQRVPAAGERVQLVELGTHCRGAVFLDGNSLKTAALEAEIDRISRGYEGFYFGRYDVRCADVAALQRGEFQIIELNGLTSEATHIYDPGGRLLDAWRTLCAQWTLAFEIAAENRRRGSRVSGAREVSRLIWEYRRLPAFEGAAPASSLPCGPSAVPAQDASAA